MSTHDELHVLAAGRRMGVMTRHRKRDLLDFAYDDAWQGHADAFPLSLSMPLAAADHADAVIEPYLWGLLPDNEGVLSRWGQQFGVSPRHAFKLIAHVGEDCAGAVQFAKPERADELLASGRTGRVQWLGDDELIERMRLLLRDHSASRTSADQGRFSLAGAQPKTALHHDPVKDRWGVPSGSVPTTHIFKPASGAFDGYAENEHFCMGLARSLEMPAASSTIRYFGDVPVFITERYDRARTGTQVMRIHQEDACQALSRMPHTKYQNQGGPSAAEIITLIRRHSTARDTDAARFLDALLLNWLICGTDAHAKNYSLLIGARRSVRLAPLYDLASALPYPQQVQPRRATLAMKIGGKYRVSEITVREWKKAAKELRFDEAFVRDRMLALADAAPDAAALVRKTMRAQGVTHPVLGRLVTAIKERCAEARALWK